MSSSRKSRTLGIRISLEFLIRLPYFLNYHSRQAGRRHQVDGAVASHFSHSYPPTLRQIIRTRLSNSIHILHTIACYHFDSSE
jgi:hypothetical protein